jgi:hypothetical protein
LHGEVHAGSFLVREFVRNNHARARRAHRLARTNLSVKSSRPPGIKNKTRTASPTKRTPTANAVPPAAAAARSLMARRAVMPLPRRDGWHHRVARAGVALVPGRG